MSIKRTKQRSFSHGRDAEEGSFGRPKPVEPEKSWTEHVEGKADDSFVPYAMTSKYAKGVLLLHSKFGKGAIVAVEGPRIEVLFEDGARKLGHAG